MRKQMERPEVTVTLTHVLDNDFWGINDMFKMEELTVENVIDLIREDYGAFIEDGKLNVCIKMVKN